MFQNISLYQFHINFEIYSILFLAIVCNWINSLIIFISRFCCFIIVEFKQSIFSVTWWSIWKKLTSDFCNLWKCGNRSEETETLFCFEKYQICFFPTVKNVERKSRFCYFFSPTALKCFLFSFFSPLWLNELNGGIMDIYKWKANRHSLHEEQSAIFETMHSSFLRTVVLETKSILPTGCYTNVFACIYVQRATKLFNRVNILHWNSQHLTFHRVTSHYHIKSKPHCGTE